MTRYEEIIKRVDELVQQDFVTAKFGNHWKEHAKENYEVDQIIDIAWVQGRKVVLLEKALKELVG